MSKQTKQEKTESNTPKANTTSQVSFAQMGDRLKRPVAVPIDGINPAVYQMIIKHCYPVDDVKDKSALKTMRRSGVAINIPDRMIRTDATLVPGGAVFVAADYADLELKLLAHALERESNDNRTNKS